MPLGQFTVAVFASPHNEPNHFPELAASGKIRKSCRFTNRRLARPSPEQRGGRFLHDPHVSAIVSMPVLLAWSGVSADRRLSSAPAACGLPARRWLPAP